MAFQSSWQKINAVFLAWPVKNVWSLIDTPAVGLLLIIHTMQYQVVPYSCFDLLHSNRLKYLLALNAPVKCFWSRLRLFHLMPEDILLIGLLPISNTFKIHLTYSVSGDNSFTSSSFKVWILIDCSWDDRGIFLASVLFQTLMARTEFRSTQRAQNHRVL